MRLNPSSHSAKQSQQQGWFEVSKTVLAEPGYVAVSGNRLLQQPFPAICHESASSKMRLRNKSHFPSRALQNATVCCGFLTSKKKSELLLALPETFHDLIAYGFEALPPLPDTSEVASDTWEKLGPAPDILYDKL